MKIEFKYATIIAVALFFWLCLEFWLGFHDAHVDFLPATSFLTIMVWGITLNKAIREKKKLSGFAPWGYGKGFKAAFVTTLLALPLLILTRWVFYDLINTDFFNNIMIKGREWISLSAPTQENFDNSVRMMEDFFEMKAYQSVTLFFNIISGLLFSLTLPLLSRKK